MNTHFPSLDFDLGEEIEMLRESVYQFARMEIAPRAADMNLRASSMDSRWSRIAAAEGLPPR